MSVPNEAIKLSMDYGSFTGGVDEIARKMKQLDSEFKLAKEKAKSYADEQTNLEIVMQELDEKISLQTKKVNESQKAYENAASQEGANKKSVDRLKQSYLDNQVALEKLNNELKESEDKLDEARKSTDEVQESNDDLGESLDKANKSAADYAGQLYIVQQALSVVKDATMAYIEFDTSISKVNTIADTTKVSIGKLKEGVYDIAKQTGKSATDISNALYECISANVKTEDSLKVTLAAANLAKTGFTDTATSVNVLTTIMNAYKLSADEVTTISDKLIQVQNLGKTTVGEFGDAFGKVAGLSKEAGISLDEIMAAVATLTKVNGSASESITSLKAGISNIVKPTTEASKLAKELGLNFSASALQSQGFAGFLQTVKEKTNGNIETMSKLFGSVEALNSMLVLTGSGAESFASDLESIQGASGTTEEALNNLKGTGNNFNDAIENLKTTLIQLGDILSPIIDMVSGAITIISNIPKPILAVMFMLTALIVVIKNITRIKVAWGVANTLVSVSMGILSGTTAITTASMMKFLIVIAAIVAIIGLIIGSIKSVKSAMSDATSSAETLANSMNNIKSTEATVKTNYTSSQYHASGTDDFQGGETWVGEAGPEKVVLPRGSKIISNDKATSGENNIFYVNLNVKDFDDLDKMKRLVLEKKQAVRKGVRSS